MGNPLFGLASIVEFKKIIDRPIPNEKKTSLKNEDTYRKPILTW